MDGFVVAVIGGGFSGLVLANSLSARLKSKTIIFEKLDRVGKKILATGNGRGNFTNTKLDLYNYHGGDPSFARYALKKYDNKAIRGFFDDLGVSSTEEDGRVFPASLQANALLDALRLSLGKTTVSVCSPVTKINRCDGGFIVSSEKNVCFAKAVVLCAGGKSSPHLGSDGSGYELVKPFGHFVAECYPTLVRMRVERSVTKGLVGIKHYASVTLCDGDGAKKTATGDFLFADGKVSGNTVFSLSSYLPALRRPRIVVDFITQSDTSCVIASLIKRVEKFPDEPSSFLLSGVVHSALAAKVAAKLFDKKKMRELTARDLERAVSALKNYSIDISGCGAFDEAQVTRGGVATKDVSDRTMMSKLVDNLYICGEMLDVDGDCGGYNLQWAFSSAKVAADDINERFDNR